jgi:Transglutaminase-like superfamily
VKLFKAKITLGIFILLLASLGFWLLYGKSKNEWHTKTLLYSFSLKNTSHNMLTNVQFNVLLPKNIQGNQHILLDDKTAGQKQPDVVESSNVKHFVTKVSPYGSKIVSFTLQVEKNNIPQSDDVNVEDYLNESQYIQIADSSIQVLAKQLKAETSDLTAKKIYNWLVNNIVSENYSPESRGALATLTSKTGDCTEFTYLFIALARANGIPARGLRGLYIPQQSLVVGPMDYHDWAEFYDGDHWVIVDAQKQIFDSDYVSYLSIASLTDTNQNSKRFSVSNDSISVSFQ